MSSKAIFLLRSAKRNGIHISVNKGELQLKFSKDTAIDPILLQEIKDNKEHIIDFLNNPKWKSTITAETEKSLKPYNRGDIKQVPLSFGQERLWFIDHLEGTRQYHVPAVLRLRGNLNKQALSNALQAVVERHEILRSVITEEQGESYQRVMEADRWNLVVTEAPGDINSQEALRLYIRELIDLPFDLSKDYMLRATLIRLAEQEHVLVVTMHHIASDGWSVPIIVKEVTALYKSFAEGRPAVLEPLQLQYADFALWQREHLRGTLLESKIAYWKQKLQDVPALQLPSDYPRPLIQSTRGGLATFSIDKHLTGQIHELANQQGATLFMTLLATFYVLLHRYTDQQDICVGTPIAGRQQEELEALIGFFVNTLALRTSVHEQESFTTLLQAVKNTTVEAYQHQELPFEKVVEAVVKERDLSRSPLFQVMFVLQNTPGVGELSWPELTLLAENLPNDTSKFDITFFVTETDSRIEGSVEYCTDLYQQQTITRMIDHYKNLLASVVKDPAQKTGLLPMLSSGEEEQLLQAFNNTSVEYAKDKTMLDLFEEQAARTPSGIALVFEDQQLTYRQLNERSNQLAHYLLLKGVKAEMRIPIFTKRGTDMVVGMFAILKAGGSYVPIDAAYPPERISFMLEDTAADIVICSKNFSSGIKGLKGIDLIEIDGDWPFIDLQPATRPLLQITSDQLAYVIYTSGSTGKPKGVMIEHGNLYSFICWCREEFSASRFNIVYATTSICFDLSVFELFFPLSIGKPVRILENGSYIGRYLPYDSGVLVNTVPTVMQYLLQEGTDLKNVSVVNLAGEPIPLYVQQRLNTENTEVRNLYGPTEDTTYSTVFRLTKGGPALIGKPISNKSIQIRSNNGTLVPIGVPGQIHLKGSGLARGYLNNTTLTNEKFIPDVFSKTGGKVYQTGDLGRWLADGNIEYLGRMDNQVKVRGFRIELGEIVTVLQQYSSVRDVVVLSREDDQSNKRLVAYIVPEGSFDVEGMTSYLKSRLPAYMMPAQWVALDKLPLTPNGKIDRKALPDPGTGTLKESGDNSPVSEAEKSLVQIWQQLMKVERVGTRDNFFELGGHSLLGMRVIAAIRRSLNVELAIKDLFIHPTISSLAALIRSREKGLLLPPIEAVVQRPEHIPLSFSQERLWFIDRLEGSVQYHLPSVLRLKGNLDKNALASALQQIVNRHEILRTVILEEQGKSYQLIKPQDGWKLYFADGSRYKNDVAALQQHIHQLVKTPFDLSRDYKLRADLISIDEHEHLLVATMHHIASDGWSTSIIVRELVELYSAFAEGRTASLQPLKIQYADYAIWQRNHLQGEVLESKLQYWKEKLSAVTTLQLPTDFPRPAIQSTRGANTRFEIDRELTEQLKALSRQQGTTLFMTLLATFNVMLYRYSGQPDICVGTPIAGRNHQEVEPLIGFFINTLALRSDLGGNPAFTTLLQQVKTTTLEAYENQELPFEKVAEVISYERDVSRNRLFQIMLSLHNNPEVPDLRLGEVKLLMEEYEPNTSQLDMICNITETGTGLSGSLQYCTDLFLEKSVEQMMLHFKRLLISVIRSPHENIGSLSMLSPEEEHQLLVTFNNNKAARTNNKTLITLFEEQVEKTPGSIAIIYEEQEISFQELNAKANQLAHYLKKKGVGEEALVPICVEQSLQMAICILGILKTGAAYVPVDPNYPEERISYILEDTRARIIVTTDESISNLPFYGNHHAVALDGDCNEISREPQSNLESKLQSGNLAYIIYTSGSTGRPKGVMVDHESILSYLLNDKTRYVDTSSGNTASFIHLSYTFDASLTAMFMPLLSGKPVVIGTKKTTDVFGDPNLHKYAPYDFIKITPSHLPLILPRMKTTDGVLLTKKLVIGGEAIFMGQFRDLVEQRLGVEIINEYGPTEASVGCSIFSFHPVDDHARLETGIPIGKPIDNVELLLLGSGNELVPVGAVGEICIAGPGLARGYLNQPDLTREKFVDNPFTTEDARMYKTGDLGRWLPDGNMQYKGRFDDQVKIRGYRIELEEIENVLQQSESVRQAVVIAKENKEGGKRLVAYIVPENIFDKEDLLEHARKILPDYMIPVQWISLETLPLTSNGKADRRALPDPEITETNNGHYTAPRNDCEKTLVSIWQELLDVEKVGIHDNFFELGGDSIISIQLVSRARRAGYELRIEDLFSYQTISSLSDLLAERSATSNPSGEQLMLEGPSGLLPIQQWYFDRHPANVSYFNQAVLLTIDKSITEGLLDNAFNQLEAHHDALRFRYYNRDGQWLQVYESIASSGRVNTVDLHLASPNELPGLILEHSNQYQQSLDIEKGELARVILMQTPSSETFNRLLIVVHHLVIDGVSWRILLEDLDLMISGIMTGTNVDLGAKTTSYRQWHEELEKYGQSERALSQKEYWKESISHYYPLPVDHQTNEPVKIKNAGLYVMRLGATQTRQLTHEVPRVYHTEINDILLAAIAKTLTEFGSTNKIVIGMEGHGREHIREGVDTSRTIGWFTTHYPLLLTVDRDKSDDDLIKNIKEQFRKVPDKGIGFGILKYLNREEILGEKPSWNLLFNYLGQSDNVLAAGRYLGSAGESAGNNSSPEFALDENLSVNGMVQGGELVLNWTYSNLHYKPETVIGLVEKFRLNLEQLISFCLDQQKISGPVFTPSDFGLGENIHYDELDLFLNEPFLGKARKESLESLYRLSPLQQGILFHGLYDETGLGYINHFWCDIINPNLDMLQKSWDHIMRSHTSLRSAFYHDSFSIPVQAVYKDMRVPVCVTDLRGMSNDKQLAAINQLEESDRARGFDFKVGPMMRVSLVHLTEDRYKMLWSSHHIIFDGWSRSIIMGEFLTIYGLLVSGKPLPVVPDDRFEDYIHYIERLEKENEKAYWKSYLRSIQQSTFLPFINNIAERNKGLGRYGSMFLTIDSRTTERLERYAQANRITVNTLMQGVWSLLLHHYTGSNDIVYGVIVSGRPHDLPHVEDRVGMFINAIPLYSGFLAEKEIASWLQGIQHDQVASRNYQYTPLAEIQPLTGLPGDLFDSLMVFENYPVSQVLTAENWALEIENVYSKEQTNYPLSLIINHTTEITVDFSYNTSLLRKEYIEAIRGHFEHVLQQLVESGSGRLGDIRLLTRSEENQLLEEFNNTTCSYPEKKTIIDLLEERVAKSPTDVAIVMDNERITYAELHQQSNRFARYLQKKGVKKNALVAICVQRSIKMVIGMLAVLKAGAAYVPIDPEYPAERILYTIEDSAAEMLISDNNSLARLPRVTGRTVVLLDDDPDIISGEAVENLLIDIAPDQLAYVIYTSGSTGKPKGVMIQHSNVYEFISWCRQEFASSPFEIVYAGTSICFDLSVFEIFFPLSVGKTLRLLENGLQIGKYLAHDRFVMTNSVPGVIQSLLNGQVDLTNISVINMAGEPISAQVHQGLDTDKIEVRNLYGPTEDTTYTTMSRVRNTIPITIGRPITNTRIYILDKDQQLLPVGVMGEICIAGAGLSKGYLNRPELTSEKFIKDPFSALEGAKMYKTGDWGRWLPDGSIEYLGRKDEQVKVRGYRIEPGEIENVLQQSELVSKSAVVVRKDKHGNSMLTGYVVPHGKFQRESLIRFLKARLPEYMVPGLWVELEYLPLTPNGKTDRKALPDPDAAEMLSKQFVPARNELERKLSVIWKEVLSVQRVGIHDSFFELGGHSLLVMQMISAVKREFRTDLSVRTFFELNTIEELASYIRVSQSKHHAELEDYDTIKL